MEYRQSDICQLEICAKSWTLPMEYNYVMHMCM